MPGLANLWVPADPQPHRHARPPASKSPIGVKVSGDDLAAIRRRRAEVEQVARSIPGVTSALAERADRRPLHRRADRPPRGGARGDEHRRRANCVVAGAVGGENVTETVEGGRAQILVNLRYPREWRDLRRSAWLNCRSTPAGRQSHARHHRQGDDRRQPRRCSRARTRAALPGWVYVDVRRRDLARWRANFAQRVAAESQSSRRGKASVRSPVRVFSSVPTPGSNSSSRRRCSSSSCFCIDLRARRRGAC